MSQPSEAVLTARDVYHIYRDGDVRTVALRGVAVVLEKSSWTTVMGPSGSGKSTLLHILAGLLEPTAGMVTVDGEDVTRLPAAARAQWRRRSVGLVLQRDNLHPHLDVAENVALPLRLQGMPAQEIRERVTSLLEHVGLAGRSNHRSGQLSGGEAQRAALAVALAPRPRVLLADEPTGELDSTTAAGILDLIGAQRQQNGTVILTVTHNRQVTERAGRRLAMRDGVLTDVD